MKDDEMLKIPEPPYIMDEYTKDCWARLDQQLDFISQIHTLKTELEMYKKKYYKLTEAIKNLESIINEET